MTAIQHFDTWYKEELSLTKVNLPAACCLSTIGLDGFPNARFVALKDIVENSFIVTGPLTARKGIEINANSKVALTFWWAATERQIRIQGFATKITEQLADQYFAARSRESQLVSIVSEQGKEAGIESLARKYEEANEAFSNRSLARPENWGGYSIDPIRIEFLAFKPTRFHERILYELVNGQWTTKQLQP